MSPAIRRQHAGTWSNARSQPPCDSEPQRQVSEESRMKKCDRGKGDQSTRKQSYNSVPSIYEEGATVRKQQGLILKQLGKRDLCHLRHLGPLYVHHATADPGRVTIMPCRITSNPRRAPTKAASRHAKAASRHKPIHDI